VSFAAKGRMILAALGLAGLGWAALVATPAIGKAPAMGKAPAKAGAHNAAPHPAAWAATVTVTGAGAHTLGNPQAKARLVEYMSYTCPHCAAFEGEAGLALRNDYVATGKASWEIRHFLLNPIDMTVAMLTNCLPANRFFAAHREFLVTQPLWIVHLNQLTDAQRKAWENGTLPARMNAIASDMQLYPIIAKFGLTRAAAQACFANTALQTRLEKQTEFAEPLGVNGTPSFFVNDQLQDTNSWPTIAPKLAKAAAAP
jgi:protein-disulfide isomerase